MTVIIINTLIQKYHRSFAHEHLSPISYYETARFCLQGTGHFLECVMVQTLCFVSSVHIAFSQNSRPSSALVGNRDCHFPQTGLDRKLDWTRPRQAKYRDRNES